MRALGITAAVAVLAAFGACGKKAATKSADDLKVELAAHIEEINAFMSTHDFTTTGTIPFEQEIGGMSEEFDAVAKEASVLRKATGDERYAEVAALAQDGAARTAALAQALGAGPHENVAAAATFAEAAAAWAAYNDSLAHDEAFAPAVTPGPGRGNHYGWWKNPPWANDPASRPAAGTAVSPDDKEKYKEREKDRERKRGDLGGGNAGGGHGYGRGGK